MAPLDHIKAAEAELAQARAELEAPVPVPVPPAPVGHIVGINGASASTVQTYGIKSGRLIFLPESTQPEPNSLSLAQAKAAGLTNCTCVIGNVMDGTPLSSVNTATNTSYAVAQAKLAQESGIIKILEFQNEPQFKGGVKNPIRYAEEFLSTKKAFTAAGITLPLGFTIFGDYQRADKTWSQVAGGNGWTADAVRAVPGLVGNVDFLVHHTYGRVGENLENNLGTKALEVTLAQAASLGLPKTFYVTEFGLQIGTVKNYDTGTSEKEQAEVVGAVGKRVIKLGAKGIWAYAVIDGGWTFKPEAYKVLAAL